MRKANPLFVDSTKMTSDSVGCAIELKNLQINEGETVYAKIIDPDGNEESTSLSSKEDGNFSGQIWLNHHQDVSVQFYIMGTQGILKQSKLYPSSVTYVMQFQWIEEIKNQAVQKDALNKQKSPPSEKQIMEGFTELSSLIDKWGL